MEKGSVDDADDGYPFHGETDGDAEHGEEVGEVDGAVEGVDDPCGRVVDEVVSRCAGRVGLFADEFVRGELFGDGLVNELFDICRTISH